MSKKRVPFIEQLSQTECGLSCVAMISQYYKKEVDMNKLREVAGSGRDGNSLYDIYKLLQSLDFDVKTYRIELEELKRLEELKMPTIIYWNNNHYVVLTKIKSNNFYIIDPAEGRRKVDIDEFKKHFSRYILTITPNESFQSEKSKSLWIPYIKLLIKKPKTLLLLFFSTLLLQSFVLSSPILTQYIIDTLIKDSEIEYKSLFLIAIITFVINYFIFNIIQNEISLKYFKFLDFNLSDNYIYKLLYKNYSFFQTRQTGDLIYRFSNLRNIRNIISNQLIDVVLNIILLLIILVYMSFKSLYLTFFVVMLVAILHIFILVNRPYIHELNRRELFKDTNLISYQNESVMGILDVKITGIEEIIYKKWRKKYFEYIKIYISKERFLGIVNSFSTSLTFLIPLILILLGSERVINKEMTFGELVAFQTLATYFVSSSKTIISSIEMFFQLKVYLRRISDVIDTPLIPYDHGKNIELKGSITLEDISFKYSKIGLNILNNINIEIKSGEKVAIVGSSGAGKSTLSKIIANLYSPTQGNIYFDGVNSKEINRNCIKSYIGVVPQEPYIFNDSVKNNISLGLEEFNMEDIIDSCKVAQIHEEIMSFPMNYNTILSERGENLSGGQRQRISIARMLVRKPKILVLDESTNALDSIKEKEIEKYLNEIKTTRIIVAHRLSTIIDSDQIILLDKGEIKGVGTHDELIKNNDFYKELYSANSNNERR